jgi:hypothetical protein
MARSRGRLRLTNTPRQLLWLPGMLLYMSVLSMATAARQQDHSDVAAPAAAAADPAALPASSSTVFVAGRSVCGAGRYQAYGQRCGENQVQAGPRLWCPCIWLALRSNKKLCVAANLPMIAPVVNADVGHLCLPTPPLAPLLQAAPQATVPTCHPPGMAAAVRPVCPTSRRPAPGTPRAPPHPAAPATPALPAHGAKAASCVRLCVRPSERSSSHCKLYGMEYVLHLLLRVTLW